MAYVAVSETFGTLPGNWETLAEAEAAIAGATNTMWRNVPGHWKAPVAVEASETHKPWSWTK